MLDGARPKGSVFQPSEPKLAARKHKTKQVISTVVLHCHLHTRLWCILLRRRHCAVVSEVIDRSNVCVLSVVQTSVCIYIRFPPKDIKY